MVFSLTQLGAVLAASAAVTSAWPSQKYETEKFQTPVLKINKYGKPNPGYLFMGLVHAKNSKQDGPNIVDNDGDLVWHGPSDYDAYYNFQTQEVGGETRLTWWNGYLDRSGHGYGHVVVMDNKYQMLKKICFPKSVNIVVPRPEQFPGNTTDPCYVDKHESIATDRNSIIVTAYNTTEADLTALGGPKNGWVYDCLFFELDLDTNEVLFQWSALDHVPVTKSNYINTTGDAPLLINGKHVGSGKDYPWDYFHINSVDPVPGGYIINSRMTWSFYKIDGKSGKIDWTLEGSNGGDFKLLDPIFYSWQHHPRLQHISGKQWRIHLFNNDNVPQLADGKNVSSGYILNVDMKKMEVSTIADLKTQKDGPIYATAEGSVQNLDNGHHLVGYGSQPYLEEYDGDNNLIMDARFGKEDVSTHAYRIYRKPWVGNPQTQPKAAAALDGDKINVYASWNGATQHVHWNVLAGPSRSKMSIVAENLPKKGFETAISINNGSPEYNYVQVQALDHKKKVLSSSKHVRVS